jgi:hypothetical protein
LIFFNQEERIVAVWVKHMQAGHRVMDSSLLLRYCGRHPILVTLAITTCVMLGVDHWLNRKIHIPRSVRFDAVEDVIVNRPNYIQEVKTNVFVGSSQAIEPYYYAIRTDEHGCRVDEQAGRPANSIAARARQLVVLGDSFSVGAHAPYRQTIAGILEARFPDWNVSNFSVSGTCSSLYPAMLKSYMRRTGVSPDLLLVGLYVCMEVGDIPRVIALEEYGRYKSCAHVPVSPTRYESILGSAWGWFQFRTELFLRENSSLYNLCLPPRQCKEFAVSLRGKKMGPGEWDEYESMLLANLEVIHDASGIDRQNIVFWLVPSNHQSNFLRERSGYPEQDVTFYEKSRTFWDRMSRLIRAKGYQVIDPRHTIDQAIQKEQAVPYTVDGHCNALGYQLIGEQIMREAVFPGAR